MTDSIAQARAEGRAEGIRDAAARLDERHISYMTAKGRNPADYTSEYSSQRDDVPARLEALTSQEQPAQIVQNTKP